MKFNKSLPSFHLLLILLSFLDLALGLRVVNNLILYGDQYFDEDILVLPGATLTIKDATNIIFDCGLSIDGTFEIIGHEQYGIKKLDFRSGYSFVNRGNMYFRNIAPTGDASNFVISPDSLYNYGLIYFNIISCSTTIFTPNANYQPRNFTLAPSKVFQNHGIIDFDSELKVPEGQGFLYLGNAQSPTLNNCGSIKVAGRTDFSSRARYVANEAKGIEFHGPVGGVGKVYNTKAFVGVSHESVTSQKFLLNNGLLYVKTAAIEKEYSYSSFNGGNTYFGVVGMKTNHPEVFQKTSDPYKVSYVNTRGVATHFKNTCKTVSMSKSFNLDYSINAGSYFESNFHLGTYMEVTGTTCNA